MYNLGDDKELDRLSREAAGKYDPPGQPNWEAMQQKLDEIMPVEKKKRRIIFFWWLFPLLLLGGAATYWYMQNGEEKKQTDASLSTKTENKLSSTAEHGNNKTTLKPADEPTEPVNTTVQAPPQQNNLKKNSSSALVTAPVTGDAGGSNAVTLNVSKTKKQLGISAERAAVNEKPRMTNSTAVVDESIRTTPNVKEGKETTAANATASRETNQQRNETVETKSGNSATTTIDDHLTKENQNNSSGEVLKTADTAQQEENIIQHKASHHNGFSIAFVAGVDKSTVKFTYGSDAGINIGMIAGYHFNDRWSLHTGAIYTQKNYKLAGKDFTAPKGTPMSYYKIETLEGYCRMWEVPLVARYTLNPAARNTTFFSTGLSSYFMTKENYSYLYYYNNQPVTRTNTYNSSDTHVLSIWDLSVGFNKSLGKSWSMLAEPYAKIPLSGVGMGNIRLSSFGINFSVQYRQPSKK